MMTTSTLLALGPEPVRAPSLYDRAVTILRERYYDKRFRETELERLAKQYRPAADTPPDLRRERDAVTELLSHIPATHLAVLSEDSFNYLIGELNGEMRPTFGFLALGIGKEYFTFFVLEGGPAQQAGVLPWERIVSIDGKATAESARLEYQQKDAYLPIDRDPPMHSILGADGDEISLVLEREPGMQRALKLRARPYSALTAARASVRTMAHDGREFGYVHFWFIHSTGVLELMRESFAGAFANADGLILDLRGRGGNGVVVQPLLQLLADWGRPIVALTDRQSRSAKDALAYEFKRRHLATVVGERTAGAVIPASFASLGKKTMLMFPSFTLGEYTERLELKGGVEPDIAVERSGPYSAGQDKIFERALEELARLAKENGVTKNSRITPAVVPTPPSALPAGSDLPSTEELISKMVAALGGEKTLRAHAHRTLIGTTEMLGLPMKGKFIQKASAPDMSFVAMNLGDLQIRQGFDGTTAWTETSMNGLQLLSGSMADAIRQQAQFYGPLDLLAANKAVMPIGFVSFDNKNCVEMKLVGSSGGVSYFYVDAESFLIAGTKATIETPMGKIESKTYFRGYRDLGGWTAATEISIESSVQRQIIRIREVSFDPIAPEEFAVPATTR